MSYQRPVARRSSPLLLWAIIAGAAALAYILYQLAKRGYDFSKIGPIAVYAGVLLYAIIIHEISHGLVADRIGDKTARRMGRLTLNPVPHINIFGTLILPIVLYFTVGFAFGYAEPVPVNPLFFRHPWKGLRGLALTSAAGPGSNVAQAIVYAFVYRVGAAVGAPHIVLFIGYVGALLNLYLAAINLIPIPPLDGSKILAVFLPPQLAERYLSLSRFGFLILLPLFYFGGLSWLGVIVQAIVRGLLA
jgi:Zn-dependent protease